MTLVETQMNSIIAEYYDLFQLYQSLRNQLMAILSDEELAFKPGGGNLSLGILCREIGEVQFSYIQSFETLKQDFSYRNLESGLDGSVARLQAWFEELDNQLRLVIEGFSEDDLQNKMIDRGDNFIIPPRIQLEIYKEALLIFYGKSSVYLKMMGKQLPEQWQEWIN